MIFSLVTGSSKSRRSMDLLVLDRLRDDLRHILRLDLKIADLVRMDHDDRAPFAKSVATRTADVHLVGQPLFLQLRGQTCGHVMAARGMAGRARAQGDNRFVGVTLGQERLPCMYLIQRVSLSATYSLPTHSFFNTAAASAGTILPCVFPSISTTGPQGAAAQTVDRLQAELQIQVRFTGLDARQILDRVQNPRGASHVAGRAHADMHPVTPLGHQTERLVECGNVLDPGQRHIEPLASPVPALPWEASCSRSECPEAPGSGNWLHHDSCL